MHTGRKWPFTVGAMLMVLLLVGCHRSPGEGGPRSAGMMGGGGMMSPALAPVTPPEPAQSDAAPAPTVAGNHDGARKLYRQACGQCHAVPQPSLHSAQAWPAVVDRMRQHLRQYGQQDLTDSQIRTIVGYLQQHAAQ